MYLEEKTVPSNVSQEPSLAGFIAWLERQPSETRYYYGSPSYCAFAQYLRANGFPEARCGGDYWHAGDNVHRELPMPPEVLANAPQTFGKLASVLRALR